MGGAGLDSLHLEFCASPSQPTFQAAPPLEGLLVVECECLDAVLAAEGGHVTCNRRQVEETQCQVIEPLGIIGLECHEISPRWKVEEQRGAVGYTASQEDEDCPSSKVLDVDIPY